MENNSRDAADTGYNPTFSPIAAGAISEYNDFPEQNTNNPSTLPADFYAYLNKKNTSAGLLMFIAFIVQVLPGSIFGLNALSLEKIPLALKIVIAICTAVFNIDLMFFMALKGFEILRNAGYALSDILNQDQEGRPVTLMSVKSHLKSLTLCKSSKQALHETGDEELNVAAQNRGPEKATHQQLTSSNISLAGKNLASVDLVEWTIRRGSEVALTWWSLQNYAAFANSVGKKYAFLKPISWMLLPGFLQLNFPGVVGVTDVLMNQFGLLLLNVNQLKPNDAFTNKIERINQKKNVDAFLQKVEASLEAFMKTRAFPDDIPDCTRKEAFTDLKLDPAYQVIKDLAVKEAWSKDDKNNYLIASISITNSDPKWMEAPEKAGLTELLVTPIIYGVVLSTILVMFTILLTLLGEDENFSVLEKVASTWVNIAVALIGGLNFADSLIKKLFADDFSKFTLSFDKKHSSGTYTNAAITFGYILAAFSSGSMIAVAIELYKLSNIEKYILFTVLVISIATFNGSDVMNQILDYAKYKYQKSHDQKENYGGLELPLVDASDPLVALLEQEKMIHQLVRAIELMPAADAAQALTQAATYELVDIHQQQVNVIARGADNPIKDHMSLAQQLLAKVTNGEAATTLTSITAQAIAAAAVLSYFFNDMTYDVFIMLPVATALLNSVIQFAGKNCHNPEQLTVIDALWTGMVTLVVGVGSGLFIAFFNHFVATAVVTMPPANEYKGELTLAGCALFSAAITAATTLEKRAINMPETIKTPISEFFKSVEDRLFCHNTQEEQASTNLDSVVWGNH
jgi:hypothetical protein